MEALVNLGFLLALLVVGYAFGRLAERRHYRSILLREDALRRIPAIATKFLPDDAGAETFMVTGSVVVSVDYFKRFFASLRLLVGGRLTSYESLVDRARREAILRMKDQARRRGADAVFNVKLETASISKGSRDSVGSVEVLAYGTALRRG